MLEEILLLILSILPVFLIALYMYHKDPHKESIGVLFMLFFTGVMSALIVIVFSYFIYMIFPSLSINNIENSGFIIKFIKILFGIAIIEEGSKWLLTYIFSYNSVHFDEYYDIILFSVFVALGFACFENIIYVFQNGFTVGAIRLFTAVPAHCFFEILMGYYLGLAKMNKINGNLINKRKYMALSIIMPTILHCFYDYFAFLGGAVAIVLFITTVIFGYIISIDIIQQFRKLSTDYRTNFCSNCGNKVDGNFCSFCGKRVI